MKPIAYFALGCLLTTVAATVIANIQENKSEVRDERDAEHFWEFQSIPYAQTLIEDRAAHEQEWLFNEERKLISGYLSAEESERYMKFFIDGFHSNTGSIMIEGGENALYERAYLRGYQMKQLLIKAYRLGIQETHKN